MRDKATAFETDKAMFDMVHGHTKIELTDVNTGETKVIEKDNTFQSSVLAQYMRSMGAYNNNPYANGTWAGQSVWRNLVGGLLLFKDAIDLSNGDVEYMPAGNVMTGNGAYGVTNSGTPTELGSYNSVESVTSGPDSLTFVYDFTTSQAVGDIACVCLTSEIGGYIGYGNKSGNGHATTKAMNANQSSRALTGLLYNNYRWTFTLDAGNNKVSVVKTPTEASKGSVFDLIAETAVEVSYVGTVSGTSIHEVIYVGGGKAALLVRSASVQSLADGSTYSYLLFDLDNMTASVESFTNNTGESVWISNAYSNYNRMPVVAMTADYVLVKAEGSTYADYTTNLYSIKLSDSSAALLMASNGIAGSPFNDAVYPLGGEISDGLIMFDNRIYDTANGTFYPTNGTLPQGYFYSDETDTLISVYSGGVYKNPLYLATVNNLDSPVNKTAAQTMKVTYTLTKA